jgi:hypothetical protein
LTDCKLLGAARAALHFLTPAEAEALRQRLSLDAGCGEDEDLRELARELSALKRRRRP